MVGEDARRSRKFVDGEKLEAATRGKRECVGAGARAGGPSQPRKSRYTSFAAR